MTKKQIVAAILEDMYERSGHSKRVVDITWKAWLKRQRKDDLERIYNKRMEHTNRVYFLQEVQA